MKFLITYHTNHAAFDEWLKTSEDERKAGEGQMEIAWNAWMDAHQSVVLETKGVGRPKRITAAGIEDSRNDTMLYSFVEAESPEAAAEIFKDHPHLGILNGWIEVMPVKDIR